MPPPPPTQLDAIILGGGAAGLMCAIEAGKRGRQVVVLEHNDRPGRKILISGGGRCNFTNLNCRAENFLSSNPHFAKSALARYTPADFIALVRRHGIRYHEKTLGQLFCDHSAHEITTMLEAECADAGAQIVCRARVQDVRYETEYIVRTSVGEFRAPALVVAAGGLSIPKIGATGLGYELARQFGLKIVLTRPALVPFLFSKRDLARYGDLAGVAADVIASVRGTGRDTGRDRARETSREMKRENQRETPGGHAFREKMLFTHRGLSGPAILQASLYWQASRAGRSAGGAQPVSINLAPDADAVATLTSLPNPTPAALRKQLRAILPNRLADRWIDLWMAQRSERQSAASSAGRSARKPAAQVAKQILSAAALREFVAGLREWTITPAGDEGYEKAEVTAGGVDTNELSSSTMESKKQPGLYFIGEVVDVTGQLGGYNFQWAWSSAAAAGRAL